MTEPEPTQPADRLEAGTAAVQRPPFAFAKKHGVLVTGVAKNCATVLVSPSARTQHLIEIRRHLGMPMSLQSVSSSEFETRLQETYEHGSGHAQRTMADLGDDLDLSQIAQALSEPEDLLESQDDAPIIRLINALFTEAVKEHASDIHVEPFENRLAIRMRVDGMLREVAHPPRVLAPLVISRIKVMAKLDIAEKRLPQDGRVSLKIGGRAVDVRVSTLPSGHGERVVLRLLDKQPGKLNLTQLGMPRDTKTALDALIHRPHGIILVTGPTGSGKTTTLYAALDRLNDRSRNIMTVEDPIEYDLDGIGQTQVNPKVELTFARGLRAILRQDPDVIMLGEIRDLETAQIAVQASLTGHLVLTTLHTNTAVGAITRLRDMGVQPFLLASSLIGVLAQRLVRLLCDHCKQPYPATAADLELLGHTRSEPPTLFAPGGCEHCGQLGYRGRTGIYELVAVDDIARILIHDIAGEHELERHARTLSLSIRQQGQKKVLAGDTSLDEVMRVTLEA